jgi:ubiquitin-conjugating enzyme E2 D/E
VAPSLLAAKAGGGAAKRLQKELRDIVLDPPEGISASPTSESNLFEWTATVIGPANSPYADGVFFATLKFPPDYPFKPFKLRFTTKIYHPNVGTREGYCCLGLLHDGDWSPALTVSRVLSVFRCLLVDPGGCLEHCQNDEATRTWRNNVPEFTRLAREWTLKHAI